MRPSRVHVHVGGVAAISQPDLIKFETSHGCSHGRIHHVHFIYLFIRNITILRTR